VQNQSRLDPSPAATAGKSRETLATERVKELGKTEKREEQRRQKEEVLFKPLQTRKVPFGVDPKTVLC
jgi:hypothetical protein